MKNTSNLRALLKNHTFLKNCNSYFLQRARIPKLNHFSFNFHNRFFFIVDAAKNINAKEKILLYFKIHFSILLLVTNDHKKVTRVSTPCTFWERMKSDIFPMHAHIFFLSVPIKKT